MSSATGVSCGDATHCWAVGFGTGTTASIDATRDGGTRWTPQTVPTSVTALAAISCVGQRDCVAVGSAGASGAVLSTAVGGALWNVGQAPAGAAAVTAVQCTAKLRCLALATDGMTYWSVSTVDRGATWVRGGSLPAGMTAAGLSCSSSLACMVAGYSPTGPGRAAGSIATTSDGGATWAAASVPPGSGLLRAATCAAGTCLAAGTTSGATTGFVPGIGLLLTSADHGATWQTATASVGRDDAFGAACPDFRTCLVVGTDWDGKPQPAPIGSIMASLDGGRQWRAAVLRYVPVGMASVSCPAVNHCEAVGGNVFVRITLPVKPVPTHKATPGTRAGVGTR